MANDSKATDTSQCVLTAGKVLTVLWHSYSTTPLRVRLVRRYTHPAGNGWYVNIFDPRARRFSKIEQAIGDEDLAIAIN